MISLYGTILGDFRGVFLRSFGGRTKSGFPQKLGFNCQSQPKGFMRLDEEARKAEEKMLQNARRIEHAPTLKRILKEALPNFERALDTMPPQQREEALGLYLERIRRLTFGFHLVIVEQTAREAFVKADDNEDGAAILVDLHEDMQNVSRLYRFS